VKRSHRLLSAPPYPFARWASNVAKVRQSGIDVIRLDIGSPDLPPPEGVIRALCQSAQQPDHHSYPGYRGLPVFRNAIAQYYAQRFGVEVEPENEIVPIIGSKEGIINIALAVADPGDVILVPDPGYAPYTMGAGLAGADVFTFPLLPERDFLPELDAIPRAVAEKAVLMWLNYPNNPTGAVADLELLAQAVDFAKRYDLLLCHDAPYCDVTYDGYVAPSVLQVPGAADVAIEFNSLSKTWNMAGWRVGMAVGNADALGALAQLKSNFDSGIFRPIQEAAASALALDPGWISMRNGIYRERLQLVLEQLADLGFETTRPCATLYIWAKIPETARTSRDDDEVNRSTNIAKPKRLTSEEFAASLLNETGVALAPGSFFGPAGEGYVRISITAPTPKVREAIDRLRSHLTSNPANGHRV
jgi:LL-diaminopimelate aminotransferase